jgi:hypothetical protein
MKKLISFATSFLLGFAFFVAGSATALEITDSNSQDVAVTESDTVPQAELVAETPVEEFVETPIKEDVYCFQVGKSNELGGDCFCVQDVVSEIAEVDCLIASGIISIDLYDDYRRDLGLID